MKHIKAPFSWMATGGLITLQLFLNMVFWNSGVRDFGSYVFLNSPFVIGFLGGMFWNRAYTTDLED